MTILGYKLFATNALAQAQAAAIWTSYSTAQRTARGLPVGESLDRRRGVTVRPPVTTSYLSALRAAGETRAALPVDEYALSLNGQVVGGTTVNTSAPVAASALPPLLRALVTRPFP